MTTSLSTSEPATAGLPDIAVLTRLANEFFRAAPGLDAVDTGALPSLAPAGQLPGHIPALPVGAVPSTPVLLPSSAAPQAQAPTGLPVVGRSPAVPQPVSIPGIPNEAELRALLAPQHRLPTSIPGLEQAPTASSVPSFYFLNEPPAPRPVSVGHLPVGPADPFTVPVGPVHAGRPPFDLHRIRADFPLLDEQVNGKRLVWFDNAATTQKPRQVIERIAEFYRHENSNIHRAAHALAARSTDAYEAARSKVQRFLGAGSPDEIIFVRGATEGINLIAHSWGRANLKAGDEIVLSVLEHHANIVPWQQVAAATGAVIRVAPVDETGQIILDEYAKLLTAKTKLVSFTQVSNALGTVTPAKRMVELAHAAGARVLVDGAQAVSHMRVDVRDLGVDWYVFSGHKVFGPTGIGAVYGRKELLDATPPWQGGGNMILDVTFEKTVYHPAPARFEAGTGSIADAVGLGAAIDYVMALGMDVIDQYEHQLLLYATSRLREVKGLRQVGTAAHKASVLSFVLDGYETTEVGKALDAEGIAVRSGHHCAQPILRRFGLEATVRPSLAFYNTCAEVDHLVATLHRLAAQRR
jgi:cysteine desulfurase/selenocysteine lyase